STVSLSFCFTTTAVSLPSFSGSNTTVPRCAQPINVDASNAAINRTACRADESLIDTDDELGATDGQDCRWRAYRHCIGRLLGDATGDDRERTLAKRGVELTLTRRRVECEAIERQRAVGSGGEQRIVAHRDADRAIGACRDDVG